MDFSYPPSLPPYPHQGLPPPRRSREERQEAARNALAFQQGRGGGGRVGGRGGGGGGGARGGEGLGPDSATLAQMRGTLVDTARWCGRMAHEARMRTTRAIRNWWRCGWREGGREGGGEEKKRQAGFGRYSVVLTHPFLPPSLPPSLPPYLPSS